MSCLRFKEIREASLAMTGAEDQDLYLATHNFRQFPGADATRPASAVFKKQSSILIAVAGESQSVVARCGVEVLA